MKRYQHYKDMVVGSFFKTTYCGNIEILDYKSAKDITIRFVDTGTVLEGAVAQRVRRGLVTDPFHPYIAGLGYIGTGIYNSKDHKEAYQRWFGIFYRIFMSDDRNNLSSYQDCSVDDRWCNFQNFSTWYYEQPVHPEETYDIDKDLKVEGNRVYGPDTCVLIPESLNVLMSSDKYNPLAQGVSLRGRKFRVRATIDGIRKIIGSYDDLKEASKVYRVARQEAILNRANKLHSENKITDQIMQLIKERYLYRT